MQDFDRIYRENAELLYRYLFSLSRDAALAEELTQQAFYEAIRSADRYRGEAALSTWLCGIGKNLWKKELARQARQPDPLPPGGKELTAKEDTEQSALASLSQEALQRCIQALPEQMRELVRLRIFGDLSFAEIGRVLGKTENWARVNFYRAKQKLKEDLQEGGAC